MIVLAASRGSSTPGLSRIKLTDFGIAKLLDAQGVTSANPRVARTWFRADRGGHVGPQTDVFALGVLMYECMVEAFPSRERTLRRFCAVFSMEITNRPTPLRPKVGRRWPWRRRAPTRTTRSAFRALRSSPMKSKPNWRHSVSRTRLEADAYFSDRGYRSDRRAPGRRVARAGTGRAAAGDVKAAADLNERWRFGRTIFKSSNEFRRPAERNDKALAVRLVALFLLALWAPLLLLSHVPCVRVTTRSWRPACWAVVARYRF